MRSLKLGTMFGIGIYVHWTFLLLLGWVLFSNPGPDMLTTGLYVVGVVLAMFACVVLHELGHALTARYFGIGTRDITLYPIGGIARLERMSDKPWEEFWIALAGPAVNVVIASLLLILLLVGLAIDPAMSVFPHIPAQGIGQFLMHLLIVNGFLVLFNLIPAFPMDGGRVLRALLAMHLGQLRATEIAVPVGGVIGLLAMSLMLWQFQNPLLIVIGLFVFFAGQQELYAVRMRARQRQEPPLEVLPVVKPVRATAGPSSMLDLRPTVSVYTWDPKTGGWIREAGSRPVRMQWGGND
jgi:Zn-dependent protease